jgi:hypothetical protein
MKPVYARREKQQFLASLNRRLRDKRLESVVHGLFRPALDS